MPPCEPVFQVIESGRDGENLEKLSMENTVLNEHYIIHIIGFHMTLMRRGRERGEVGEGGGKEGEMRKGSTSTIKHYRVAFTSVTLHRALGECSSPYPSLMYSSLPTFALGNCWASRVLKSLSFSNSYPLKMNTLFCVCGVGRWGENWDIHRLVIATLHLY